MIHNTYTTGCVKYESEVCQVCIGPLTRSMNRRSVKYESDPWQVWICIHETQGCDISAKVYNKFLSHSGCCHHCTHGRYKQTGEPIKKTVKTVTENVYTLPNLTDRKYIRLRCDSCGIWFAFFVPYLFFNLVLYRFLVMVRRQKLWCVIKSIEKNKAVTHGIDNKYLVHLVNGEKPVGVGAVQGPVL